MKRNVLFGIILSGTSLSVFAQSADSQKNVIVTPNASIQNMDWSGRSTVGALDIQAEIKLLDKKLNLTIGSGAFNSLGNVKSYSGEDSVPLANNGGITDILSTSFKSDTSAQSEVLT